MAIGIIFTEYDGTDITTDERASDVVSFCHRLGVDEIIVASGIKEITPEVVQAISTEKDDEEVVVLMDRALKIHGQAIIDMDIVYGAAYFENFIVEG